MRNITLTIFVYLFFIPNLASKDLYRFRLLLSEKDVTEYSLEKPGEFLSEKAIERRAKYQIPVDVTDFPVSGKYIAGLKEKGVRIITQSKWMNSVVVECADSLQGANLVNLEFVDFVKLVWLQKEQTLENIIIKNNRIAYKDEKTTAISKDSLKEENYYGKAFNQIQIHNGDYLHDAGYRGEGMLIALMDAGFSNADKIQGLKEQIVGYKDFTTTLDEIFSENISDHGTKVFSTMAANLPNQMVGTAPNASYWLFRTEVSDYEFPIEEDFWVAAAEYADSLGVDIINTSLGYSRFDSPTKGYTTLQLDGKTAFITQAADMAAQKGILVCSSAGNEGAKDWRHITAPSDGEHVFTVGSITKDSIISVSSSRGPTADGRIKPDVVAMGVSTCMIDGHGEISTGSGTSFSSPVMAGLMACLWQAFPRLSNIELMNLVKQYSSSADLPNNMYGYGIPNIFKAYISHATGNNEVLFVHQKLSFEMDSTKNVLLIKGLPKYSDSNTFDIQIISAKGDVLIQQKIGKIEDTIDICSLAKGFYILSARNNGKYYVSKFIK